jgi:hypothetical protein
LKALADDGALDPVLVTKGIQRFGIDPEKRDPVTL